MKAELRRLHSPDVASLETFSPKAPFGILVQAMVGPAGCGGEESFDFMLCTPDWFRENMTSPIISGRHHVFVTGYCFEKPVRFVNAFLSACEGESWPEVAQKVGRSGGWEFEDYTPYPTKRE